MQSTAAPFWRLDHDRLMANEQTLAAQVPTETRTVSTATIDAIITTAIRVGALTGPGTLTVTSSPAPVRVTPRQEPTRLSLALPHATYAMQMSGHSKFDDMDFPDEPDMVVHRVLTTVAADITEMLVMNDPETALAYNTLVRAPQALTLHRDALDAVLAAIADGDVPDAWPRVSRVNGDATTINALLAGARELGLITFGSHVEDILFMEETLAGARVMSVHVGIGAGIGPVYLTAQDTFQRSTRRDVPAIGTLVNAPLLARLLTDVVQWFNDRCFEPDLHRAAIRDIPTHAPIGA